MSSSVSPDPGDSELSRCPYGFQTCPGCQGAAALQTKQDHCDKLGDHENGIVAMRTNGLVGQPIDLQSPSTYRSQLREEFMNIFYPASLQDPDFLYSQFFTADHLQPRGASMTAAVDTLCLLHLGAHHKDDTLLREASKRRGAALVNLTLDLGRKDALRNDETVGAMWILNFCDSFQTISTSPNLARIHLRAVERVLTSRPLDAPITRLGQILFYNIRSTALSFGLLYRKPVHAAGQQWARHAAKAPAIVNQLIDLILQVPGLLGRVDRCVLQATSVRSPLDSFASLLEKFVRLEGQLVSWLVRWMGSLHGATFREVPVSEFPHFAAYTKGVEEVFTKANQFPSFAIASLQITYWTGLLQVRQTILELMAVVEDDTLQKLRNHSLLDEVDDCTADLCKSAAYCTQSQFGYCGLMRCVAPVYFAAKWFMHRGDRRKLEWCKVTMSRIQENYQFIPPYGWPWDMERDAAGSDRVNLAVSVGS